MDTVHISENALIVTLCFAFAWISYTIVKVNDMGKKEGYRQGWNEAMIEALTEKKNEGKAEKLFDEFVKKDASHGR